MKGSVPYGRPRGSLYSLEKLDVLGDSACRLLCVSERSLYVLLNWVALDATFASRYAVELTEDRYRPVGPEDPEWELYRSVVNNLQLEISDMSCDIENGLLAIADAIASIRCGGGGSSGSGYYDCISPLPNEEILGPEDSTQGDPEQDPVPEGFETWEEYFTYKCQAAHFIWELERKHLVALYNFEGVALTASVAGPILAGLAGILPAAFTPAGAAVFLTACLAIAFTAGYSWFYMGEMIDWWDENKEGIVCALFNAGSSPDAVSSLANAVEDAVQAITAWGALEPVSGAISGLLAQAFAATANNGFVEPLFKSIAAVSAIGGVDCSDCYEPMGDYGCFTFSAGLGGNENYGCGSIQYDPISGKNGAGCCTITIPPQCESDGIVLNYWNGLVVSEGDVLSAWFMPYETIDAMNISVEVYFTDDSYQGDFVVVTETTEWQYIEMEISAGNDGKTVSEVRAFIQKSLNMDTRRAKVDDICLQAGSP